MSETFGQRFNALLKNGSGNLLNRRWKKQDFAERLGRHPDTISNWANGKTAPNDFDLKAVIQILQLSEQEGKEFRVLRDEAAILLETKRSQARSRLAAVGQPSVGSRVEDEEEMPINRRTFLGAGLAVLGTPASSRINPHEGRPEHIYRGLLDVSNGFGFRPPSDSYAEALKWNLSAFNLLEDGQFFSRKSDMHLLAGVSGALVANASSTLGNYSEAIDRARTALLNAELAGVDWLQIWLLNHMSNVSKRSGKFLEAMKYTTKARSFTAERGTSQIKLLSFASESYAKVGDHQEAILAIEEANRARQSLSTSDEFGDWFTFRHEQQLSWECAALRQLGQKQHLQQAQTKAAQAIDIFAEKNADQQRPTDVSLINLNMALASIKLNDLDFAKKHIDVALPWARLRHSTSVVELMNEIYMDLARPTFHDSRLANNISAESY